MKSNREESDDQTRQLRDEVVERLEKTREEISAVEGRTETSIGEVNENIQNNEEKNSVSIITLSDSIKVREKKCNILIKIISRVWRPRLKLDWRRRFICCCPRKKIISKYLVCNIIV